MRKLINKLFSLPSKAKKIIFIAVVLLVVVSFFAADKKTISTTENISKEENTELTGESSEAEIDIGQNEDKAEKINTEPEAAEIKPIKIPDSQKLKAALNHDFLKFETYDAAQNFALLAADSIERPWSIKSAKLLTELSKRELLLPALKNLKSFGYVLFVDQDLDKLSPTFVKTLFNDFTTGAQSPYFWLRVTGNGTLSIAFQSIPESVEKNYAQNQILSKYFTLNQNKIEIILDNIGSKIGNQNASELANFVKENLFGLSYKYANLEGRLNLDFTAIQEFFPTQINQIIEKAIQDKKLQGLLEKTEFDGALLVNLNLILFPPDWTTSFINYTELRKKYFPINWSDGKYQFMVNFHRGSSAKDFAANYNKITQHLPQGFAHKKLVTYLDLPIYIDGKGILRYFITLNDLYSNFHQQDIFPEGTSVQSVIQAPLSIKNQKIDPSLNLIFQILNVDKFLFRSLDGINGDGKVSLPIIFSGEQIPLASKFINIFTYYLNTTKQNIGYQFHLELPIDVKGLKHFQNIINKREFQKTKWNYNQENITVELKMSSVEEVIRFQSLLLAVKDLVGAKLVGNFEIPLQELKINNHLRFLLNYLNTEVKNIGIADILQSLNGTGTIYLYPDPKRYRNEANLRKIVTILKNNPQTKKTWESFIGEFHFQIPEDFVGEAEEGSLRHLYEYINAGGNAKLKQARINGIIAFLKEVFKKEYKLPTNLKGILELLSDRRRISEVLEERANEGY